MHWIIFSWHAIAKKHSSTADLGSLDKELSFDFKKKHVARMSATKNDDDDDDNDKDKNNENKKNERDILNFDGGDAA